MARIQVVGSSRDIVAALGSHLLEVLQKAGHPISTSCGGRATCGLCRLTVVRGGELLSDVNDEEVGHLGNVAKVVGIRLACQAEVVGEGDIVVDVPPVTDVVGRKRKQQSRRAARGKSKRKDPTQHSTQEPPRRSGAGSERIEWRPRILSNGDGKD